MRGKVLKLDPGNMELRITPAYAGKSIRYTMPVLLVQDHPRLCGEKPSAIMPESLSEGSPPPMRGKGLFPLLYMIDYRITPAYAGKSRIISNTGPSEMGSPPPMRGKGFPDRYCTAAWRITPAYAGKSD